MRAICASSTGGYSYSNPMGAPKRPHNSRTSPRKVLAAERQRAAIELRKAGASYPQIARELGYAQASSAQKAVETALRESYREPAEQLLQLELERLDRMQVGIYSQAINGDLASIQMCLRIMERRAKYCGLDAPTKQNVSIDQHKQLNVDVSGAVMVIQGTKAEYIAGLQSMRGEQAPAALEGTLTVVRRGPATDFAQPTTDAHWDDADDGL